MKTNYCAFTKRKRASLATIIGHRGIPTLAPENTLESFRLAFDQGADIVEMDVRLSRDNQVVVIHDRDLKRTTGVEKRVSELTIQSGIRAIAKFLLCGRFLSFSQTSCWQLKSKKTAAYW